MLNSAHIKNIRNIVDERIELSPNVNVIAGASTQGKSATLRSILLPILNKPSGYDYKPHKLKRGETSSSRLFFDNCDVKRERGVSVNKYILNGDEENAFEAMGTNVPPQIEELINIPDYLIHTQHCGYFLIDQNVSAGDVGKEINKITDLEIIDITSKKVNGIVTKADTDVKYTKKDLKEKEEKLELFPNVDKFVESVSVLDTLLKESSELESEISKIENSLSLIRECRTEIKEIENVLSKESDICILDGLLGEYGELENWISVVGQTINNVSECKSDIVKFNTKIEREKSVSSILDLISKYESGMVECDKLEKTHAIIVEERKSLKNIERIISFENRIVRLDKSITECSELKKEINELNIAINKVNMYNTDIVCLGNEIVVLEENLKSAMKQLGICPFCDQEIKGD